MMMRTERTARTEATAGVNVMLMISSNKIYGRAMARQSALPHGLALGRGT